MPRDKGKLSALFTWRSALAEAEEVTSTEDHVALRLSTFMSERGDSAFPGVPRLARESKLAESTVRDALKALESKGWLVIQRGGGRGRTNRYEARIPWLETHRETEGLIVGTAISTEARGDAERAPVTSEPPASGVNLHDGETRRLPEAFARDKTHRLASETHRLTGLNPPAPGGDFFKNTHEDDSKGLIDPAAAELARVLTRIRVAPALREKALEEVELATAWLERAREKAHTNVAGYFACGFTTGELPALTDSGSARKEARFFAAERSLRNLMAEGMAVDDVRYFIDIEWEWLTSIERSELHLLVDELVSDELPEPRAVAAEAAA